MEEPMVITDGTYERDETESDNTNVGLRMSLRERPRKESITRKLRERTDELRFLNDFDPEKSEREKRKTKRKDAGSRTAAYDEYGNVRHTGIDICDCMNSDCPGCWVECDRCNSTKCGPQCRVNRKFFYESISFDGKDITILNPNMNSKY